MVFYIYILWWKKKLNQKQKEKEKKPWLNMLHIETELPNDPVIPLLDTSPQENWK